ncbi:MAG: helix-turn-helix domain-containing protein [Solirubrobacteraceae bacterium]
MGFEDALDPLVFGQRLRYVRKRAGITLDQLGVTVGRSASYLSQLENGHREPRLSTVNQLAAALDCRPAELLSSAAPSRRAELEVAVAHIQEDPLYRTLRLPYLKPSARLDSAAMEHIVALFQRVQALMGGTGNSPSGGAQATVHALRDGQLNGLDATSPLPEIGALGARAANAAMREEMRRRDNYFEEIETIASDALQSIGYTGAGAVAERHLTDVAAHFGFQVARVQDLPSSTRSITDLANRVVYVPQRNATGGTRSSRSVIAQTLGHFALGHVDPADFEEYVRQRVQVNYFAGALLAPEQPLVWALADAKRDEDISVADLGELFYISYEMAAHRVTNLVTRHFGIPVHFQRSDSEGLLWKAYENDGVLLPADIDGTIEGQRLCRWWSSRQAFESEDSFELHYQRTDTVAGTFWCVTHLDLERTDAITVGTIDAMAHWFRGSDTTRHAVSRCPDPTCCRQPAAVAAERWEGSSWPSARDHSAFVSGLPTDTVTFDPNPGVDMIDVYAFLDRHAGPLEPAPLALDQSGGPV